MQTEKEILERAYRAASFLNLAAAAPMALRLRELAAPTLAQGVLP